MGLLLHGRLDHLLLESAVLALDLRLHILAFVLFHPLSLTLKLLLQFDVLLAGLVDVLEQVYSCLVLSVPLLLPLVPLLRVLLSHKFIDHGFVGVLVLLSLQREFLNLNRLPSVLHLFFVFSCLNASLVFKGLVQQDQVPLLFGKLSLLP